MIYATLNTPKKLMLLMPGLLHNEEEAARLLKELETSPSYELEEFEEYARRYSSIAEAFSDLYTGSVSEFKQTKCEDYGINFSDYSDFMAEWITEHCSFTCWVNNKELVVIL